MTDGDSPEFVFPPYAIPALRGIGGAELDKLVEGTLEGEPGCPEQAAFVLMIVRLAGCVACQADSFRAMRGCIPCSRQVIRRYAGEDGELFRQYQTALQQVDKYCSSLDG